MKKTKQGVRVSDHALLRYLERVKKVNVEEARKELLGGGRQAVIREYKNCNIPVGEVFFAVVRNECVITVRKNPSNYIGDTPGN